MSNDIISIIRQEFDIPASEEMLTNHDCAKLTGVSVNTLAQYRSNRYHGRKKGPRFVALRGRVFYPKSWVQDYLTSRGGV